MTEIQIRKAVLLYLYWLAVVAGAVVFFLSGLVPFVSGRVDPVWLVTALAEAEIFFVFVLWPFFIPALFRSGGEVRTSMIFLQAGMLFLFALPLVLVCEGVSRSGLELVFSQQILVVASAVFVGTLFQFSWRMKLRITPFYHAAVVLLGAGVPFAAFLISEYGRPVSSMLACASPFWAVLRSEPALILSALLALLSGGLVAAVQVKGRRPAVDGPGAAE